MSYRFPVIAVATFDRRITSIVLVIPWKVSSYSINGKMELAWLDPLSTGSDFYISFRVRNREMEWIIFFPFFSRWNYEIFTDFAQPDAAKSIPNKKKRSGMYTCSTEIPPGATNWIILRGYCSTVLDVLEVRLEEHYFGGKLHVLLPWIPASRSAVTLILGVLCVPALASALYHGYWRDAGTVWIAKFSDHQETRKRSEEWAERLVHLSSVQLWTSSLFFPSPRAYHSSAFRKTSRNFISLYPRM